MLPTNAPNNLTNWDIPNFYVFLIFIVTPHVPKTPMIAKLFLIRLLMAIVLLRIQFHPHKLGWSNQLPVGFVRTNQKLRQAIIAVQMVILAQM